MNYLKVRVVEAVDDVPAKSEELSPLYEQTVEETEREEKLLVLDLSSAAWEGALIHKVVQALHVCLESLFVETIPIKVFTQQHQLWQKLTTQGKQQQEYEIPITPNCMRLCRHSDQACTISNQYFTRLAPLSQESIVGLIRLTLGGSVVILMPDCSMEMGNPGCGFELSQSLKSSWGVLFRSSSSTSLSNCGIQLRDKWQLAKNTQWPWGGIALATCHKNANTLAANQVN